MKFCFEKIENCLIYWFFFCYQAPLLVCADGPFRKFLMDNVDIVKNKYWPTLWCFESRAQTVLASLLRSRIWPHVQYRRFVQKLIHQWLIKKYISRPLLEPDENVHEWNESGLTLKILSRVLTTFSANIVFSSRVTSFLFINFTFCLLERSKNMKILKKKAKNSSEKNKNAFFTFLDRNFVDKNF